MGGCETAYSRGIIESNKSEILQRKRINIITIRIITKAGQILAQIPQESVEAIEKGESVTLPIGQKIGMSDMARNHLSSCIASHANSAYFFIMQAV